MQLHHEKECPAYPVVCEKCYKDGTPRAEVNVLFQFHCFTASLLFCSHVVIGTYKLAHILKVTDDAFTDI